MNSRTMLIAALVTIPVAAVAWAQAPSTAIKGFVVDQLGNVGVGTSAPTTTLHVAGPALIEGAISGTGNGQWGSAAVINGFDTQYGSRKFLLRFQPGATPQQQIAIQAINPVNPTQSVFKTFIIDDPRDSDRYLVHASIEGPEGAVYYRGSAQLANGRAEIRLPPYFEGLARKERRTVQLTNVGGFDPIMVESRNGATVSDGRFVVRGRDPHSRQRFDWEVKAVRADGPPLTVEPLKSETVVGGLGPYTYQTGTRTGSGR